MASLRQPARKASEGTAQADASPEQALPGARSPRDPAPAGNGFMGPTALDQNTRPGRWWEQAQAWTFLEWLRDGLDGGTPEPLPSLEYYDRKALAVWDPQRWTRTSG